MLRTAVLQRQESATGVGRAGRIAFRKLAQTYLSEISVSNFFSFSQTKFFDVPRGRQEIGLNFREICP
ncbi:hypothetical protein LMG29660_06498 [Burkholderia puraquae]|uniref:Uncharacterized protein n=1 Tax=Burkholderia puraquae TaxID=1904757 RepID=A0A6J5EX02_9BURK|nr:hypothetical protein LMG29660_06498 [Burkholderia puraquae]